METMELPRIGNRSDALELLERLIKLARKGKVNKALILGLLAIKDVIEREAI
jgi:hypothetical protein